MKYNIADSPDHQLKIMLLEALNTNNSKQSINMYEKLTKHVLKAMGGFNIDGWKLRTGCE